MTATHSDKAGTRLERCLAYLRADEGNPGLLAEVFDLSLATGHREQARAVLGEALRRYPDDDHFRFRLATFCIAERRLEEAEKTLTSMAAQASPPAAVLHNLAHVQMLQGRHADAARTLRGVVERPDSPPESAAMLVRCLHHCGELEDAARFGRERLETHGADPSLAAATSLALWDLGGAEEAGTLADEALASFPSAIEALVTRGSIALSARDATRARESFERAIAVHAEDGRSWSGLGLAQLIALDVPAALASFEHAVAHMPDHIGTWHAFGWCQLLARDAQAAQASFARALALDRTFAESHGGLAVALAIGGRRDEADEAAQRALRLDPQCLSARYAKAILDGEIRDAESFRGVAERLLAGREGIDASALGRALARLNRRRV